MYCKHPFLTSFFSTTIWNLSVLSNWQNVLMHIWKCKVAFQPYCIDPKQPKTSASKIYTCQMKKSEEKNHALA